MIRDAARIDAEIAALRVALASGAKRCRFADGREVEYRNHAEITAALNMLADERATLAGAAPVTRVAHAYNSGLSR